MRTSTVHLEKALAEFNSKVDDLSRREDSIEMLDALINRGAVLSMLDYVTSAKEDFDDAVLLMDRLAGKGVAIDAGYYVRAYVSRAELYPEDEEENALADYQKAIGHLADLRPGSKYYDKKNIAEICSISTQSIGDLERLSLARPFIDKGLEMTSGEDSSFFKNIRLGLLNYSGYASLLESDHKTASEIFSESCKLAAELYAGSELEDPEDLVFAFASKADADRELLGIDIYLSEMENTLSMIDELVADGVGIDQEIVSTLHGEIAKAYMEKGNIAVAEKHLLRRVSLDLDGSDRYIRENTQDRITRS